MKYSEEWNAKEHDYRTLISLLSNDNSKWKEQHKEISKKLELTEKRLQQAQEWVAKSIADEQRRLADDRQKEGLIKALLIKDADLFKCVFDSPSGNTSCGEQLKKLWQQNKKFVKQWQQENLVWPINTRSAR